MLVATTLKYTDIITCDEAATDDQHSSYDDDIVSILFSTRGSNINLSL